MLKHYLLVSMKVFARRPFFTFVSLFGICLTLVVLTLAAALLEHTFGAVPPEVHADRMLGVFQLEFSNEERGNHYRGEGGYSLFDRHLRGLENAEEISLATIPQSAVTFIEGQKVPLSLRRVDGAFFRILEFDFLEGGPFTDEDNDQARPLAVINLETRRRLFGEGPAIDESFEVDGQRFRVVGVTQNVPSFRPISAADMWVPIHSARSDAYRHGLLGRFQAFLLAKEGHSLAALKAEAEGRLAAVDPASTGEYDRLSVYVESPFDSISREILELYDEDLGAAPGQRMRFLIIAAALLFMVLPSLNLINLNISRILERASEIGVRKSFGASSRTLVLQFVIENLVLTLVGGLLGFVLAALCLEVLSGTAYVSYAEIGLNFRIFAWGMLLATIFGLISGVYPAWRMSRLHPKQALEESAS